MGKLRYIILHEAATFDLNKRMLGVRKVRFNFKSSGYCSKKEVEAKCYRMLLMWLMSDHVYCTKQVYWFSCGKIFKELPNFKMSETFTFYKKKHLNLLTFCGK